MINAKGMAALKEKGLLVPYSFERRQPKAHDVVIEIKFCGVCHSDIHMTRAEWGLNSPFPMVPGHEISGIVQAVGNKVSKYKVGDKVAVGCMVDSCRKCTHCEDKLEQYCLEGMTLTYGSIERDGSAVTQGGYSNVIVVDENYVLKIPKNIPLDKAAPLLCAGITVYSPLKHWKAGPNKKVGVMGLGGLGHMAVKIAAALGAEVSVLSHSEHKKADALTLGAHRFLLTKDSAVFEDNANYFDLIINTVSSAKVDLAAYFGLLKLDASLVSVGAPEGPLAVPVFALIFMRRNFAGSTIGSIKETQELIDFCGKHDITPDIELIEPSQINEAFERVLKSDVRYRFVIDMSKI